MQSNKNNKKVHNAGPLGILLSRGQIKSIDLSNETSEEANLQTLSEESKPTNSHFKTDAGVVFTEQELIFVDPKECEPWQYANRHETEMGNMEELIQSIRENGQLQPALVRPHSHPHGGIKYEVIFGRRRHRACLQLETQFLVILKEFKNDQDAIAYQDAENKFRKDISNYANALLYKKLLDDEVFKNDSELAKKLGISKSSLSDLFAYTRIPTNIVNLLPDVHSLSISMALKITGLLSESKKIHSQILNVAHQIGTTITSPTKLDQILKEESFASPFFGKTMIIKSEEGKKLFTLKTNHRGTPCITVDKDLQMHIDYEKLCAYLKAYFQSIVNTTPQTSQLRTSKILSGAPDKTEK